MKRSPRLFLIVSLVLALCAATLIHYGHPDHVFFLVLGIFSAFNSLLLSGLYFQFLINSEYEAIRRHRD